MGHVPTIKGIFVNSHVKAVRRVAGRKGIEELEKLYGAKVDFKNTDDIPVSDEVKLLEAAVVVFRQGEIERDKISYESGVLHFNDFATTSLGKMLFATFTHPRMLLQCKYIAEHVFQGITFEVVQIESNVIKLVMEGGNYPLDHFKGLFHRWVEYLGYVVNVNATQLGPEAYEYIVSWEEKDEVNR